MIGSVASTCVIYNYYPNSLLKNIGYNFSGRTKEILQYSCVKNTVVGLLFVDLSQTECFYTMVVHIFAQTISYSRMKHFVL